MECGSVALIVVLNLTEISKGVYSLIDRYVWSDKNANPIRHSDRDTVELLSITVTILVDRINKLYFTYC